MSNDIKELHEQTLNNINLNLGKQEKLTTRSEQMSIFCAALNGLTSNGIITNPLSIVREARIITSIVCDNDFKNKPNIEG